MIISKLLVSSTHFASAHPSLGVRKVKVVAAPLWFLKSYQGITSNTLQVRPIIKSNVGLLFKSNWPVSMSIKILQEPSSQSSKRAPVEISEGKVKLGTCMF